MKKISNYPSYDLADNDNLSVIEANYQAALSDMIAVLDRTDLATAAKVIRLLTITSRPPHFFKRRRTKRYRPKLREEGSEKQNECSFIISPNPISDNHYP